jgi:hypothetical protein
MIQYIADAFTDKLFAGNPAAVLPCREMPAGCCASGWKAAGCSSQGTPSCS